jgi:N-acetyl sugar amidotransferase
MKWCQSCVLPDTRPNLYIGSDGVCNACKAHRTKDAIDWAAREGMFRQVVAHAQKTSLGYDCLVPVSGGKDSTWQIVRCLEFGLTPLAVTWKTPARTVIGQRNLDNLVAIGVDHIDYQINPAVEARFMLSALEHYGSTAIPMHMALFNIPLSLAFRFKIPLVVWGENSAFEYGSKDESLTGFKLDTAWLMKYGVTHGTEAKDWLDKGFTRRELSAYFGPNSEELESSTTRAVFLGYYLPWDPETSLQAATAHGFSYDTGGARTGYYDYADIDDDFISIHHWLKWYKFGFTRLFDNLSIEIRNNRMTRIQALEIIRRRGDQTPYADIEKFCAFCKISISKFFGISERFRNPEVWVCDSGVWKIRNFLIDDWEWNEIHAD